MAGISPENNLAFRMKKNYRTYAMVTVLMICSVTVMAISIAMKQRYEKITHFDQTYTYQVLSSEEKNGEEIAKEIEQENKVKFWNEMQVVMVEPSVVHSKYMEEMRAVRDMNPRAPRSTLTDAEVEQVIKARFAQSRKMLDIREEQELSPAVTIIILLHSLSFTHLLSHFISDSFFHIIHFLYLFR